MPRAIWEERGKWAGKNLVLFLMSLPIILVGIYVLIKTGLKRCFKRPVKSSPRIKELEAPLIDPQDLHDPVSNGIELKEMQLNAQITLLADSPTDSSSSSASSSPGSIKSSTYCMLTEDHDPSSIKLSTYRKIHFDTEEVPSTALSSQSPLPPNSYPDLDCAIPVRRTTPQEKMASTYQISMWDDLSLIPQAGIDWYITKHGTGAIKRFFAPFFATIGMAGAMTLMTGELIIRDIKNSDDVSVMAHLKYFDMIISIAAATGAVSAAIWPTRFINPFVRTFQVQAAVLLGVHMMRDAGVLSTQAQQVGVGVSVSTGLMLFHAARSANLLKCNSPKLSPVAVKALNCITELVNKGLSGYCLGISTVDVWACFEQLFDLDFSNATPFIIGFSSALGLASLLWAVEAGKRCSKSNSDADKIFKGITVLAEGMLDNGTVVGSQFLRLLALLMVNSAVIENGDYFPEQKKEMIIFTIIAALTGAAFEGMEVWRNYDLERVERTESEQTLENQPSDITEKQLLAFRRILDEAPHSNLMRDLMGNKDDEENAHRSSLALCASPS